MDFVHFWGVRWEAVYCWNRLVNWSLHNMGPLGLFWAQWLRFFYEVFVLFVLWKPDNFSPKSFYTLLLKFPNKIHLVTDRYAYIKQGAKAKCFCIVVGNVCCINLTYRILTFLPSVLQLLRSGFLHRSGPSGCHHREHCLRETGGHQLCRPDAAGVVSAPHRRTCGSSASTNQADGAHLTSSIWHHTWNKEILSVSVWTQPPASFCISFHRGFRSLCLIWKKKKNEGSPLPV